MDYINAGTPKFYATIPGRRYAVSMDSVGGGSSSVSVFWLDTPSGATGPFVYENSTTLLSNGEGRGFEFVAPTDQIKVNVTSIAIMFGLVLLPA